MMRTGILLALSGVALLLLLAGCTQPNNNLSSIQCCSADATVPTQCNGLPANCSNEDGLNSCYNYSGTGGTNLSNVLAAICPVPLKNPCTSANCTAMSCVPVRSTVKPRPGESDAQEETANTNNKIEAGLVGKYCYFGPMNNKMLRDLKKPGGYVNSFRLGMQGDFSDYDRSRFYFPISDYFGDAPDLKMSVVDRFNRYLKMSNGQLVGRQTPPICLPLDSTANIADDVYQTILGPPTKIMLNNTFQFGCFRDDILNELFVVSDYSNNEDLARTACALKCSPASAMCGENEPLLVKNETLSPVGPNPNAKINAYTPNPQYVNLNPANQPKLQEPFVWMGEFDQENGANEGYYNLLYGVYKSFNQPLYTSRDGPGPYGGYAYECGDSNDCLSGSCDKVNYHRTTCTDAATGNPIDCQCAYIRNDAECDMFYGSCNDAKWLENSARDECVSGKAMCKASRQNEDGTTIVCKHDNGWKGSQSFNTAAPPIWAPNPPPGLRSWPTGPITWAASDSYMTMKNLDVHFEGRTPYVMNKISYEPNPNYGADDWKYLNTWIYAPVYPKSKNFGYIRITYDKEPMRFYAPGEVESYGDCFKNGARQGINDEALCLAQGGQWSNKTLFGWSPMDISDKYLLPGYKPAWSAVPKWQPITEGTVENHPFDPAAYSVGGAFIVASYGYNDTLSGLKPDSDTTKWTGTKEEFMSTFPFIAACNISANDIEKVSTTWDGYSDYGFMSQEGRGLPPRSIEAEGFGDWGLRPPAGLWKIKDFGNCQVDGKGWLKLNTYGVCSPKTHLTYAYQKVDNWLYDKGRMSPWSLQAFDNPSGYCPTDCKQTDGWCQCPEYYGETTPFSVFSPQAGHAYPELGWLANKINAYQSENIIPVLDLTEYNFSTDKLEPYVPPVQWYEGYACQSDTGTTSKQVCVGPGDIPADEIHCLNREQDYMYKYSCTPNQIDDLLLSYLDNKHSAAITIVAELDKQGVPNEDAKNRVRALKDRCPNCMAAVEYYDPVVPQLMPMGWNYGTWTTVAAAIEEASGVPRGTTQQAALNTMKQNKMENTILVLKIAYTRQGGELAINKTIDISTRIREHVGWPTLIKLIPISIPPTWGYDDPVLYQAFINRTDELADAGIIGVLLPEFDNYAKDGTVDAGNPYIMIKRDLGQDEKTAKIFCAAQNGTSSFLHPDFVASTVKVAPSATCEPVLCSRGELLSNNCNPMCLDGEEYDNYAQGPIGGYKCRPFCIRQSSCALCKSKQGELTCFQLSNKQEVADINKPVRIPYRSLTDIDSPKIGSMDVPCCLQNALTNETYTYTTKYSRTTSSDSVLFSRFSQANQSCSGKVKAVDEPTACNSQFVSPPLTNTVWMCN